MRRPERRRGAGESPVRIRAAPRAPPTTRRRVRSPVASLHHPSLRTAKRLVDRGWFRGIERIELLSYPCVAMFGDVLCHRLGNESAARDTELARQGVERREQVVGQRNRGFHTTSIPHSYPRDQSAVAHTGATR